MAIDSGVASRCIRRARHRCLFSQRLFERAGLIVIAYPVDFQGEASRHLSVMDFVPSAGAFKATEMAWRKIIGRVYYELNPNTP